MRRVLDPMFVYFDSGRHWVSRQGLALFVLSDMSYFMENSGIFISFPSNEPFLDVYVSGKKMYVLYP